MAEADGSVPSTSQAPAAPPNPNGAPENSLFGYNTCEKGLFKMTYGVENVKEIKELRESYEFRKQFRRAFKSGQLNTEHMTWQFKCDLRLLDDLLKRLRDKSHRHLSCSLVEASILLVRERFNKSFKYMKHFQWVVGEELHMLLVEIRAKHKEFLKLKRQIEESMRKEEEEEEEDEEEYEDEEENEDEEEKELSENSEGFKN